MTNHDSWTNRGMQGETQQGWTPKLTGAELANLPSCVRVWNEKRRLTGADKGQTCRPVSKNR